MTRAVAVTANPRGWFEHLTLLKRAVHFSGVLTVPNRYMHVALVLMGMALPASAADTSWEGKTVILTRPGVSLQLRDGEKIAPKTSGVARDFMFQVLKDEKLHLRVSSRRQQGWIAKNDAIPLDQAVAYFTDKMARNPKDSHAFTARGLALMSKNQDKALADFDKAIQLDPKATLAYYHRANLAYGRRQLDKALADYSFVIRTDPGFDWAYHVRGWIYYRKKDYDRALADYETAIRLVPTETVFYRDRGNIALVRKQYDRALADYTKSIELDPHYAVPWLQRGKTWVAKKDYAKALADYEKSVQLASKDSFASYFYVNLALFRAGCPDVGCRNGNKALEAARKAYELTKGPAEMAALAAAHSELGHFDKALEFQRKAVDLAPAEEKKPYRERLKLYESEKPYRPE
jgi:tetratricopeptide (TPR) repeat protein